jgi:quinol monooxygenase YgiN
MIYAIARMTIPVQKLEEALEILSGVTQRSRLEEGCISANLYRDLETENSIMLEQVWKNDECLEHHLRSSEYHKVLLVTEMALSAPEIRFDEVVRTAGFETVEKARAAGLEEINLE